MSRFASLVNAHLAQSEQRQEALARRTQEKQDYLDPEFKFNVNEVSIVDADTVELPNGERIRLSGEEGRAIDSYETNPATYQRSPGKLATHRRSYAEAFGLDPDDVTIEDLVIAGESQKRKFGDRLRQAAAEDGTISYRNRGADPSYPERTLGELNSQQIDLSGRFDNAGYEGKFNAIRRLEDVASGEAGEHYRGAGDRRKGTAAKDQVVNFLGGAADMANDLVQGAGTLLGVNNIPGVDKGHSAIREGVESFREAFNSPQQQRRERLEQERYNLQSEYYNVQKEKYLKDGSSETNASIRAGIDEFTNAVGNIIDNPGAILDKTVESLPYMLGVGAAGRTAVNTAVRNLQKEVLKKSGSPANLRKYGSKFEKADVIKRRAAIRTNAFLGTRKGKQYVNRVATATGIGTVGLTEGLSTSAEVYDSIISMTEEQALNSDKYVALREQGMTHEKAVQELAEDAHLQTLMSVTLAAGVASAVTGAGAFEGQLFSGLAGVRKGVTKQVAEAAQQQTKKGAVKTLAKGAAKGTVKAGKFLGKPATKEAAEELLQSGGGEFLSQLAKFEATGEEVGPGVGRAAGEGAVIGFASGAGAQATFGSLKALGTADPRKLLKVTSDIKNHTLVKPENAVAAASGKPTKSVKDQPAEAAPDLNTPEVIDNPGQAFEDELQRQEPNLVLQYDRLRKIKDIADNQGVDLPQEQTDLLDQVKYVAEVTAAAALDEISQKKPEDITDEDLQMLMMAGEMNVTQPMENLTDEQRAIYEGSVQLAEEFEEVAKNREQQLEHARGEGHKRSIRQVYNNKFGTLKRGANGQPGLGWYNERSRELMNTTEFGNGNDNTELTELIGRLTNFRNTQNKYLNNALKAVAEGKTVGNFKFEPATESNSGGSAALLPILQAEQKHFERIADGIVSRYEQWQQATGVQVQNAVTPSEAPGAVETSQATDEVPVVQEIVPEALEDDGFAFEEEGPAKISGVGNIPATGTVSSVTPAEEAAPARRTLRQAASEGPKEALEFLVERSSSPAAKAIAARIASVIPDNIKIVELDRAQAMQKFGGRTNVKGAFDLRTSTIYLNKDLLTTAGEYRNTLLHEAIHAVIGGRIARNELNEETLTRLRALNLQVIKALGQSDFVSAPHMRRILAANPEELLTHGLNTPWFQQFLKDMQLGKETAWDKFVKFVADLLGIKDQSALGEVLDITEQIFQEIAPEADAVAETQAQPESEQQAEAIAEQAKAIRLAEARRVKTLVQSGQVQPTDVFFRNREDQALYSRLTSEGIPVAQAVNQVIANIEPDPNARNIKVQSVVPQETIDQAGEHGALLNSVDNRESVTARRIPAELRNLVNTVTDSVKKALAERKLGTTLSDMFQIRRSRVRDLLASDEFIMDVLTDPGARAQFYEKIGTTPAEEQALDTFVQFYNAFNKTLHDGMAPLSQTAAANYVERNPLYYFQNDNGAFDPNVVAAMALEAMQWISGEGAQAIHNRPEDIRAILGLDENAFISADMWRAVGSGTLKTNVVQQLGYKTLSHLNLKVKEDQRPLLNEITAAAIGAQVMATLIDMGNLRRGSVPLIRTHNITPARWQQMTGVKPNEEVIMVSNNYQDVLENDQYRKVDVNVRFRDRIIEGRDIFKRLFSSSSNVRTPMLRVPRLSDIPTKVSNTVSKIPTAMRERMLHDAKKPYHADMGLMAILNKFENPEQFLSLAHDYKTQEEVDQQHVILRDGVRGRNRALLNDLTEAMDWAFRYGDRDFYLPSRMTRNGRVIIDSNVINPQASKLHRFMFGREGWSQNIVKQEPSVMNDPAKINYMAMMTAIALGMGIKTDSTPLDEVVRLVEEAFAEGAWRDALDVLNTTNEHFNEDELAKLGQVLGEEGTHTLAALNAYNQWKQAADGDVVTVSLPHETDGVTNGYIIGLLMTPPDTITPAYKALLNAGGVYFEGDPWKNFAEYKAEGNLDNYQYIAQDTRNNLATAVRASLNADLTRASNKSTRREILYYRSLSILAASGLVPDATELSDGHKIGRNWAKQPLMEVSYGASVNSIVTSVVRSAIESFHEKLAKSNEDLNTLIAEEPDPARKGALEATRADVLAQALNRAYAPVNEMVRINRSIGWQRITPDEGQGNDIYTDYQQFGTEAKDGRITAADVQRLAKNKKYGGDLNKVATEFVLPQEPTEILSDYIRSTYGRAMSVALGARLRDVLNVRAQMNAINKMANKIYTAEYNRQVDIREATGEVLTPQAKQEIREDLMAAGLVPAIQTAESEGSEDSLEMTNTEVEYLRAGSGKLLEGWGALRTPQQITTITHGAGVQTRVPPKTRTITGRLTSRVPNDDVGVSAVVKAIHALDGVINSLVWGQGPHAVLNVHDAQVSPWSDAASIAKSANLHFTTTLANYNLPNQFLQMGEQIVNSLMVDEDGRLSKEVKDKIALEMLAYNKRFRVVRGKAPYGFSDIQKGYWVMQSLLNQTQTDSDAVQDGKRALFSDMRFINQFAQQNTAVSAPNGVTLTEAKWASDRIPVDPSVEEQIQQPTNQDILFEEEFDGQTEAEKVRSLWEGLSQWETGDVDVPHQAHLRNLMDQIVAPGLETLAPVFQQVIEEYGDNVPYAMWEGDILRLNTSHRLSAETDLSLQETAAQEYISAVVRPALSDHFTRKEVRRLYELAQQQISPLDFMPDQVVGDPAIALERAQDRYEYIFEPEQGDEYVAYERFLSIGLTNASFARALGRIDNPTASFQLPGWDKGILRGMLSIVRQIVQRLSGVAVRHTGGTLSDALGNVAKHTMAANQRNAQRLKNLREGTDTTSRTQRLNQAIVRGINERFVEPLAVELNKTQRKRLDAKNPTLPDFLKSATYVALKTRDSDVRREYKRFYRELTKEHDVGTNNGFFQTLSEITPWDDANLSWMDLLRKSKYSVDMARQEVHDHTRSFINDSFDQKNFMSKAHKMAITRTMLKTDISALTNGEDPLTVSDLARLLRDPDAVQDEQDRLESLLRSALAKEGHSVKVFNYMQNQARSLSSLMVDGKALMEHTAMNAQVIVDQWALAPNARVDIQARTNVESLVDRLASIYALGRQEANDLRLTNDIMQHEMQRTDVGTDNGFTRLIGMQINFQVLAREHLFKEDPHNMIKGYVYEIFDGDVNIEYVEAGSEREQELIAEGMVLVGDLPKDAPLDNYKGKRRLYKGLRGLSTYNKSIVSLTDMQHRGANLFSTAGYQTQTALRNLSDARKKGYQLARNQVKAGRTKSGTNMVPIYDTVGNIVDYRYMMSERNKQKILKKEDPFDRVLPRMFASITDRNSTQDINRKVVDLLKKEHDALRNDPTHRFVRIGARSTDPKAKEMWRLLPEDMQRAARSAFGFDGFYIRDDVVNLVLGFRKMTVSNIKGQDGKGVIWGRGTPMVRMAEKIWQEIVSLMRIKIAILTPAVVVGNIASNTAMLLSEGIPVNYIRRNAAEAISGMRQYQKDRQRATELIRKIGAHQALGKDTTAMERRLARYEADLAANPVGQLVEEGLFTSITADLGVDDDTIRGSLLQKMEDAIGGRGGKGGELAKKAFKEAYMLPGSKGYQAAVAATQYGDFVGRYIKFKYDTNVNKMSEQDAINSALSAFIYYDIPQPKYLQAMNDSGLVMFTKFFLRIQPIVARMYTQNPVSAFAVLGLQKGLLPDPFNENIMNYGLGDGLTNKWNNPLNLPGKAWDTLNPAEPALLQWILNPFGL